MEPNRGVRKVSENIMANGRTIIVTETDDSKIDFDSIPVGTIRVKPDGTAYCKREGGTEWEPLILAELTDELKRIVKTTTDYGSRMTQAELAIASVFLKLKQEDILPDCSLVLIEDFSDLDSIDTLSVSVISAIKGSEDVDVDSLDGLHVGYTYTIADSVNHETVKIKALARSGTASRVILEEPLENAYDLNHTALYRTTAAINTSTHVCHGASNKHSFSYKPSKIWQGTNANVASVLTLDTTEENANAFDREGDCAFTSEGFFTLIATE